MDPERRIICRERAEVVDQHGAVPQAARGPIVNLPELVVGGRISGCWWGHQQHNEIFEPNLAVDALKRAG